MSKNILLTGATSGFGVYAAHSLAQEGHRVFFLHRNEQKAKELITANEGPGELIPIPCDLSSFAEIRNAVSVLRSSIDHLDILANNAGLWPPKPSKSQDNIELTLHVNLIAPYLLFKGTKDLLLQSSDARVITTSSGLHQGTISFEDLEFEQSYSGFKAYRQSKLGVILLMRYLATQEDLKDIRFFSQHPGLIRTQLARQHNWFLRMVFLLLGKSIKKGAQTLLHLCRADRDSLENGSYYAKCKPDPATPESRNMDTAERLVERLESYLNNA